MTKRQLLLYYIGHTAKVSNAKGRPCERSRRRQVCAMHLRDGRFGPPSPRGPTARREGNTDRQAHEVPCPPSSELEAAGDFFRASALSRREASAERRRFCSATHGICLRPPQRMRGASHSPNPTRETGVGELCQRAGSSLPRILPRGSPPNEIALRRRRPSRW